jgi:Tfp pilus assembly protein PilN
VTLGELSQRLRRADFLDGLGIYVGAQEVSLAHVRKRFFTVALRDARTYALPPASRPVERRQALAQAVVTFAREHRADTRRAVLCVPRAEAAFNRVVLPIAARENLAQVLDYEIEHLVPLPRDQVYFDYSTREVGDKLEVLLMCIPRDVVRTYLEALEDAFVRPRSIVLASTAIADYLAFCRGEANGPMSLVVRAGEGVELALLVDGRLLSSQLMPASRLAAPGNLSRSLARQLADGAVAADDVQLFRWELANGGAPLPALGETNLFALAAGRLEAPSDFFEGREPAVLPAVGAALDAVREGTVPVNLLPAEGRRGAEEGLSLTTVVLVAVLGVLLAVWGVSALVKDVLMRRQIREQVVALQPEIDRLKAVQAEIDDMRTQLDVLAPGQERKVTVLLAELADLVPDTAHLTSLNLRAGRLTLDGFARSASDLITALEKSKHFKNVNFTSPTTRTGEKERFSLVAEVDR